MTLTVCEWVGSLPILSILPAPSTARQLAPPAEELSTRWQDGLDGRPACLWNVQEGELRAKAPDKARHRAVWV